MTVMVRPGGAENRARARDRDDGRTAAEQRDEDGARPAAAARWDVNARRARRDLDGSRVA